MPKNAYKKWDGLVVRMGKKVNIAKFRAPELVALEPPSFPTFSLSSPKPKSKISELAAGVNVDGRGVRGLGKF